MLGVHAQTLRYYERVGLLTPSRSRGRIRLYSQRRPRAHPPGAAPDRRPGRQPRRRRGDHRHVGTRLRALEEENEALRRELQRLRDRRLPAPREDEVRLSDSSVDRCECGAGLLAV